MFLVFLYLFLVVCGLTCRYIREFSALNVSGDDETDVDLEKKRKIQQEPRGTQAFKDGKCKKEQTIPNDLSHEKRIKHKLDEDPEPLKINKQIVSSTSLRLTTPLTVNHKKNHKTMNNLSKTMLNKLDNQTRAPKTVSDGRYGHSVGEERPEGLKWHKMGESGQTEFPLGSRLHYASESSIKTDEGHRFQPQAFFCTETNLFPSRSFALNNANDFGLRSNMFKSSSGSQIFPGKSNSNQSMRQMKFGEKPPSLATLSPAYGQSKNCCCCCSSGGCRNMTDSSLNLPEEVDSPEGLSWRRLHMSRAKLKATATTSELLSGFAMVAMVELQINNPTAVPEWLFVLFAVCTTILVSVHIFALMISTYLFPNIDAVSKLHVQSLVSESPHEQMKSFIELAWAFSTIIGLFLFLVELAILCWVKFWDYSFTAAISSTMIVIPVLILFVAFAIHFYHSLVVIKCKTSVTNMQELENIKRQLDNVSPA